MKVRWLASARDSIKAQLDFIAEDNPAAAKRLRGRLHDAARNLGDFPNSGRAGVVLGTRELVIPGSPFLIVYRRNKDTVEILRVLHTATNWYGATQ